MSSSASGEAEELHDRLGKRGRSHSRHRKHKKSKSGKSHRRERSRSRSSIRRRSREAPSTSEGDRPSKQEVSQTLNVEALRKENALLREQLAAQAANSDGVSMVGSQESLGVPGLSAHRVEGESTAGSLK